MTVNAREAIIKLYQSLAPGSRPNAREAAMGLYRLLGQGSGADGGGGSGADSILFCGPGTGCGTIGAAIDRAIESGADPGSPDVHAVPSIVCGPDEGADDSVITVRLTLPAGDETHEFDLHAWLDYEIHGGDAESAADSVASAVADVLYWKGGVVTASGATVLIDPGPMDWIISVETNEPALEVIADGSRAAVAGHPARPFVVFAAPGCEPPGADDLARARSNNIAIESFDFESGGYGDYARLLVEQADVSVSFRAASAGAAGNSISVEFAHPGGVDQPLDVQVSGTGVTVKLATDASAAVTTTAAQLRSAWPYEATRFCKILVTGNSAAVLEPFARTFLSGGVDWAGRRSLASDGAGNLIEVASTAMGGSLLGYSIGGGTAANAAKFRGDNSPVDHPLPAPIYSDRNLLSIYWDDAGSMTAAYDELDNKTPYQYMIDAGVPVSFGVNYSQIGNGSILTAKQIRDFLLAVGGECANHGMGHVGYGPGGDSIPGDKDWRWYHAVEAKRLLEDAVGFPALSYWWAGWTPAQAFADGYALACRDSVFGLLLRANYITVRGWGELAGSVHYKSGTEPEDHGVCYPVFRRYPIAGVRALSWGANANGIAMAQDYVSFLAASKHLASGFWFHGVQADNGGDNTRMRVSTFKAFIDAIALELDSDQPRLEVAPTHQLAYTHPCAAGERPNLIVNPGFEGCRGAGDASDVLAMYNRSATLGPIYIDKGTGSIDVVDSGQHSGGYALKIKRNTGVCRVRYLSLPAVPGRQYSLEWWQKAVDADATAAITVEFDGGQVTGGLKTFTAAAGAVGEWVRRRTQFVVPKDTVVMHVNFAETAGKELHLDDLFLG